MIPDRTAAPRGHRLSLRAAAALSSALVMLAAASPAPAATAAAVESFASPEAAAQALAAAWHGGQSAALLQIFGPAGQKLVRSGDPVAEKTARERFAASYDRRHRIERNGAGEAILVIGEEDWPYPIPIVRSGSRWRFDVRAGAEEILDRRIGRDELNVIAVSLTYVDAQRDYFAKAHGASGPHEYAQHMVSGGGRRDGLYWPAAGTADESPLGPLVAAAEAKGYPAPEAGREGRAPYQGYYFRILTGQGARAPGGAKRYVAGGHMTGGFALIAWPARWGDSGVMTFVVNQTGIVFEKNLGPATASLASRIAAYDPDRSWKIASPSGPPH